MRYEEALELRPGSPIIGYGDATVVTSTTVGPKDVMVVAANERIYHHTQVELMAAPATLAATVILIHVPNASTSEALMQAAAQALALDGRVDGLDYKAQEVQVTLFGPLAADPSSFVSQLSTHFPGQEITYRTIGAPA
jgi:hypothetical protein